MPWTCQKQAGGVKCKTVNENRRRKCASCGKPKPKKRQIAHRKALDISYEEYIRLNGGEHCAICGFEPQNGRKLNRDHDHTTGAPRGLLCPSCNMRLGSRRDVSPGWLYRARLYLLSVNDKPGFERLNP